MLGCLSAFASYPLTHTVVNFDEVSLPFPLVACVLAVISKGLCLAPDQEDFLLHVPLRTVPL